MSELVDDILEEDDLKPEAFPTPEWPKADGKLFVRGLSGDERDAWEVFLQNHSDKDNDNKLKPDTIGLRARLVSLGMCNSTGQRVFDDSRLDALGRKSAAVLDRAYDRIARLSGIAVVEADRKN